MKIDQNARMHNTLSDLSTRRLSCEQTEMILKNYGKEINRGSDFLYEDAANRLRHVLRCTISQENSLKA